MTPYEKVKLVVESGHIAITKDSDGDYYLYSSMMSDWNIRNSCHEKEINDCYDSLWVRFSSPAMINRKEYIWVYERPLHYYKPWDKVKILESARQAPDYNKRTDAKRKVVWSICTIHADWYDEWIYWIITKKYNWFRFEHRHLAPEFDEEDDEVKKAIKLLEGKWIIKDGKILTV